MLTFKADSTVKVGTLVTLGENGARKAAGNECIVGVAVTVRDGYAGIQLSGQAELDCTDINVTVGFCQLISNGSDSAAYGDIGPYRLVTEVNAAAGKINVLL